MFDWNEEELTNIVWGEAGESDDHIVPYPEARENYCTKKEWNQKAGGIKSSAQKTPGTKVNLDGNSSDGISASGFDMDSWPSLSLSNIAKTDQDSLDTSVSNNLTELAKFDSSGGETAQLDRDPENFQNPLEGKEQGDIADYGWANIGSFDDLDRIFSNDDPIFGNVSFGNADELWSTSKDVTYSSLKSFPTSVDSPSLECGPQRNTSEHFEIKTEYVQGDDQSFTIDYGKMDDHPPHGLQNPQVITNHAEYDGGKSKPIVKEQTDLTIIGKTSAGNSQLAEHGAVSNKEADKVYKQKKLLKSRKNMGKNSELKLYQALYGNSSSSASPSSQFKNQYAAPVVHSSPSSALSHQMQLQGPETFQYQQISNPFVPHSAYGSITNPYSAMPVLSHIQSAKLKHQQLPLGYEVPSHKTNPVNKLPDSVVKPKPMTPQEKIEKLRRRQQMQAMLAIQKQQQKFGHQVSCSDQSITQKCSQENQIPHLEGADLEVDELSTLPSFDPNSPVEHDDSSTISLAVNDYSMEATILYQLQDIIGKLDVRIRLCIRDSLFRLAQSVIQRHYASDTNSSNDSTRDEQVTKEEARIHNRNTNMSEVETETNPIDRTVARLLFHRPLELSGKHPSTPESPVSANIPCESKALSMTKPSMGCFPETLMNQQNFSLHSCKDSCPLLDPQPVSHCKTSLSIDTSGNASNTELPGEFYKADCIIIKLGRSG